MSVCGLNLASHLSHASPDLTLPPSAIRLIPAEKKPAKPEEANQCELALKEKLERMHAKEIRYQVRIERLEAEIVRLEEQLKAVDY